MDEFKNGECLVFQKLPLETCTVVTIFMHLKPAEPPH
jgi:hypothetical protein